MTAGDAHKVLHYSDARYGAGTYQDQLRVIAFEVPRSIDEARATETASLFG